MANERYVPMERGVHTVTSAEATATTLDIAIPYTPVGVVVTILRGGKDLGAKAAVAVGASKITVANNSTDFVLAENDVINYICW